MKRRNSLEDLSLEYDNNFYLLEKKLNKLKKEQIKNNKLIQEQIEKLKNEVEEGNRIKQEYFSVINSNSWRITKPLRVFVKILKQLNNKLLSKINKNPSLKAKIKKFIKFIPCTILKKFTYLKSNGIEEENFRIFNLDNKLLYFSLLPLEDKRGIGRVTKEQLKYLEKNLSLSNDEKSNKQKNYFFSSIHWCPDNLPKNSIVMIHDVIPIVLKEYFPIESEIWMDKFKKIAKQAQKIITISYSSKEDIIKYLDIPKSKITVVYNGVSKLSILKNPKIVLPKKYFVYLGSYDKHKNLDVILEAMNLKKCKNINLVMIGNNFESKDKVKKLGLSKRVYFLGRLEDDEIGYVLSQAICLLFPSLYEGFGLPPMEAALLNTPAICSNRATMTEFLEDICLFADPFSSKQWADKMLKISNDIELRDRLGKLACKKIENFSWEKSGKNLLKLF